MLATDGELKGLNSCLRRNDRAGWRAWFEMTARCMGLGGDRRTVEVPGENVVPAPGKRA